MAGREGSGCHAAAAARRTNKRWWPAILPSVGTTEREQAAAGMVRKALFWSFAGQTSAMIVTFAGSVVVARLLTPHDVGIYAVAMATIGILQLSTSFGVGLYVVREEQLTPDTVDAAFSMNALLSAGLALLVFAASFAGERFLREPAVGSVLRILSVTPLISALSFGPSAMLQRAMLFRGTSVIGTLTAVLTTGTTIGAALAGARYMSPAWGSIVGGLFGSLATVLIGRQHFSVRLSTRGWRRMFAFGMRMMSIGGISSAAVRVSDIVLGNLLGLNALGLYSRATNINNLLLGNIYATMTRVVFAKLSDAQRSDGDFTAVYLRGFRLITSIMGPIIIGLAILAGPAIRLLYGERWLGAATPLSLLLVGQFVSLSFAMNWELFVIRDQLKTQTRLEISRSILGVTTQVIGSLISLAAVAATSIVDNLISAILYGRYMPDLAATSAKRLRGLHGEAILLTAIAVAPAMLLMAATGWQAAAPLLLVAGSVLMGATLWLLALFVMDHPTADELRMLWRHLDRGRAGTARVPGA